MVNFGSDFLNTPVIADDMAYFVTADGRLIAVDRTNGRTRWEHDVNAPADSAGTIAGNILYIGLRNRDLLALNKDTGEMLWTYKAAGTVVASPVVVDGVVYVGSSMDAKIVGLDAITGEELWNTELNERQLSSAMSWAEDNMVIASGNKVIYYDRRSADRVFTYESIVGVIVGTPIVIEDKAYAALGNGSIVALELEARNPAWEKPFRSLWGRLWLWGMAPRPPQPTGVLWGYTGVRDTVIAPPAAKDNVLYYGTIHGIITALDLNARQPTWTIEGEGAVRGAPAVVNDTVYISSGHYVYALNTSTGEKVWEFRANGEVTSDIVVTQDALYFADDQSNLYALN